MTDLKDLEDLEQQRFWRRFVMLRQLRRRWWAEGFIAAIVLVGAALGVGAFWFTLVRR
jgi:hypothetical protein